MPGRRDCIAREPRCVVALHTHTALQRRPGFVSTIVAAFRRIPQAGEGVCHVATGRLRWQTRGVSVSPNSPRSYSARPSPVCHLAASHGGQLSPREQGDSRATGNTNSGWAAPAMQLPPASQRPRTPLMKRLRTVETTPKKTHNTHQNNDLSRCNGCATIGTRPPNPQQERGRSSVDAVRGETLRHAPRERYPSCGGWIQSVVQKEASSVTHGGRPGAITGSPRSSRSAASAFSASRNANGSSLTFIP